MNSKTAKLISPERARALLECYGADAQAWPEDERSSALALIQHSGELQDLRQEAHALDVVISAGDNRSQIDAPADHALVARIVDALPEQNRAGRGVKGNRSKFAGKLFTDHRNWLSLAAATAAVFFISVSIMNLHTSPLTGDQPARVSAELDSWMWQQVTGESFEEEDEPLTFMSLFELDQS